MAFGIRSKEEKERQCKSAVQKTLREMDKRIQTLKNQGTQYEKLAALAIKEELPEQITLTKKVLKLIENEAIRTKEMRMQVSTFAEIREMMKGAENFTSAMSVISKGISKSSTINTSEVLKGIQIAMETIAKQTEEMAEMLKLSQDSIGSFSDNFGGNVTDVEVEKRIYGDMSDGVAINADNSDVEAQMERIRQKLKD